MRRLVAVVAVLGALLPGGCGIPDRSGVTVVGPGPTIGPAVGDDGAAPVQYARTSTNDPAQFVDYYLQAAAGDPESALDRVKSFLAPGLADRFEAGTDVHVVHLVEEPLYTPSSPKITLTVQEVGTLKSNGLLEPSADADRTQLVISVDGVAGHDGLFVTAAPQMMLLSETALNDFYQRRTIYFWNNDKTGLVPDLRYMPRSVPSVQQPTTILGWLADGPAPWLANAVQRLRQGTAAPDNVPAVSNGTLQINLSPEAVPPGDAKALDRLRRQLQWSLGPLVPRTLELKIGHQDPVRYTDQDFRDSNAAYRLAEVPERFVIYNGVIRRIKDSPHAADPVPVLKPAANRDIVAAALSTSGTHTFAAIVTGSGSGGTLRVAVAPAGEQGDLKTVRGLSGTLGHPVWAITRGGDAAGAVGLITVNGRLFSFGADGAKARPVEWQREPGPVTAVSVAPDGHRVAMVSGGRLYRTVLGDSGNGVAVSDPELLLPPTLTTVAAVAWSSETFLAVAGVRSDDNRRSAVLDLTVDGALSEPRLADLGTETVTYLAAYPSNPVTRGENSDSETYVAGGNAWDVLSEPVRVTVAHLAGSTANPPAGAVPTAPFFLD